MTKIEHAAQPVLRRLRLKLPGLPIHRHMQRLPADHQQVSARLQIRIDRWPRLHRHRGAIGEHQQVCSLQGIFAIQLAQPGKHHIPAKCTLQRRLCNRQTVDCRKARLLKHHRFRQHRRHRHHHDRKSNANPAHHQRTPVPNGERIILIRNGIPSPFQTRTMISISCIIRNGWLLSLCISSRHEAWRS